MYIRFVILRTDEDSHQKQGVFLIADELMRWAEVSPQDHHVLKMGLEWFNTNLPIPKRLKEHGTERAISWFRPDATEMIGKMRDICRVLEEYGHHVEMLKTRNPGTIIYEDQWQIIAFPPRGKLLNRQCR